MTFKNETEMFEPLKVHFGEQGYDVYAEVVLPYGGRADLIARQGPSVVCVEMKKSFSVELIDQAIRRKEFFGLVYIAIPERKTRIVDFLDRILREHGVGILYVYPDGHVNVTRRAIYRRPFRKKRINWNDYLKPEHQSWLEGGSRGGGYVTDYKLMINQVKNYLQRKKGWVSLDQVLKDCETYYRSPRSSLSGALRQYEADWCESSVIGRKLHYRYKEGTE